MAFRYSARTVLCVPTVASGQCVGALPLRFSQMFASSRAQRPLPFTKG